MVVAQDKGTGLLRVSMVDSKVGDGLTREVGRGDVEVIRKRDERIRVEGAHAALRQTIETIAASSRALRRARGR